MSERKIITDKLVFGKTGKFIEDWFKVLDKKGAKKMEHAEIFDLISVTTGLKTLGQWNQNLLTTTYEWSRELKERGQKKEGFEISVSKTVSVPADVLFKAWSDEKLRSKWLSLKNIVIKKVTTDKSLVITRDDGTSVRVELYKKGVEKSMVVVQQMKIQDSKNAQKMKTFWSNALEELKLKLEAEQKVKRKI